MTNPGNKIHSKLYDLQRSYERYGAEKASKGKEFNQIVALCEANIAYFSLTPRPDDSSPIRFQLVSLGKRADAEPGTVNPLPMWKWILRTVKSLDYKGGLVGGLEDEIQALYCVYIPEPESPDGYQGDVLSNDKSLLLSSEQREKLGATGSHSWRFDLLKDADLAKKLWHDYYREFPREVASKVEIELSKVEDVSSIAEPICQEPVKESFVRPIGEAEMNIVVASSDEELFKALRSAFPLSRIVSAADDSDKGHSVLEGDRKIYQSAEKKLKSAMDKTDPFKDEKVKANVFFAVEHGTFEEKLPTGNDHKRFGHACIIGQVLLKPNVWLVLNHCWTSPILLEGRNGNKPGLHGKASEAAGLIRSSMLPQIKKCY
jgi:hypothetical protein